MLHLQKFLQEHPEDWKSVLSNDPYHLIITESDNLVLFKYIQFQSDFRIPLVRESRGIILEKDTWEIVCLPFPKFFNSGEELAYPINFNKPYRVLEKFDGSLIKLYNYRGQWYVATNGTIFASSADTMYKKNYQDLFNDIIPPSQFDKFTEGLNEHCTFLFELIHPLNPHVVNYGNEKFLAFIGVRNRLYGSDQDVLQYSTRYAFHGFNVRPARSYEVNSLDDAIQLAEKYSKRGNEFEGFVISQIEDGEVVGRIKIKGSKYVLLHRVLGAITQGTSLKSLIEIFLLGEESEVESYLTLFPEDIQRIYWDTKEKFYRFVNYIDEILIWVDSLEYAESTRKGIALQIKSKFPKLMWGFAFRALSDSEITAIKILREMPIKKVRDFIDSYDKLEK